MKKSIGLSLVFSVAFSVWLSSNLQAQPDPFYKGKSVRIVVGFSPGGTFDLWARAVAHHMGKYTPGNPSFIVQNMPGGGSMIAANYVYAVAKPDGLTLGLSPPRSILSSSWEERRSNTTGLISPGLVSRSRQIGYFTSGRIPLIRPWRISARPPYRPSAGQRAPAARTT